MIDGTVVLVSLVCRAPYLQAGGHGFESYIGHIFPLKFTLPATYKSQTRNRSRKHGSLIVSQLASRPKGNKVNPMCRQRNICGVQTSLSGSLTGLA